MAANTAPIFTAVPDFGGNVWTSSTTANTRSDGVGTIGTDMLLLYTSGAEGSFLNKIRLQPVALVAATATTATVARLYISTVTSGATTASNTRCIGEIALPTQTAAQTTTATNFVELPLGFAIPTGYTVLMSMHHAAASNTAWQASMFAGDY
jgi:hypothetical protein